MLLLIDKPKGITSHDVVDRIRKITGERKVGHGGSLDPNATGLLIIGITRKGTKRLGEFLKGKEKEYVAEFFLGEERESHDVEGKVVKTSNKIPSASEVEKVVNSYLGEQNQIPPLHSAVKFGGKKAYDLARKGKRIKLQPREITVNELEILNYEYPLLELSFSVSSGTYIRSLARDIGRDLGTYAYLKNLRRIKVGEFEVSDAEELERLNPDNWKEFVK